MKKAFSIVSIIALALATLNIGGCSAANGITTAANIATASASILLPVNPEAAEYVTEIGTDLTLLADLVNQAKASPGNQSIIQQVQAATQRISTRLPKILNAVHIKSPQLVTEITVAVGVFNAALQIVIQYVPQAAPQQSAVFVNMPMARGSENKGKNSAALFKSQWNAVAPPDARVK